MKIQKDLDLGSEVNIYNRWSAIPLSPLWVLKRETLWWKKRPKIEVFLFICVMFSCSRFLQNCSFEDNVPARSRRAPHALILQYLFLVVQCEHCQMQKSIKLLLLDASFSWLGITFFLKYYVWRFLYQNFMGLSWILCPQH